MRPRGLYRVCYRVAIRAAETDHEKARLTILADELVGQRRVCRREHLGNQTRSKVTL